MNIKLAFRNLKRYRLNSSIIIVSLAIGMACINLIATFIHRELTTDSFQRDSQNIYSLYCDDPWNEGGKMNQCREGSAEFIVNNFTQAEAFCRIKNKTSQKVIVNNASYFDRPVIIGASSNFFSFFSYDLLTNNPESALESKNNLVISEALAKKYFGTSDPIGKSIQLGNRGKEDAMVVSGVFRKPLANTQIRFDMVRLADDGDSRCYLKLSDGANPLELEKQFSAQKASIPVIRGEKPGQYYLKSLKESYFDTGRGAGMEASRDKNDLWIALVIGLLIMGIATFNFLGLLNNKLLEKPKEYAIKKVNGGTKIGFIRSLLFENTIVIGLSFLLSILLMIWITPFFNELTSTHISSSFILQPQQLFGFVLIAAIILLITFIFLLFHFGTRINTNVLKPTSNLTGKRVSIPAFNIFQLTGTVILIVCSIIIVKQINYISNKPIGMDKEVIEIKIPNSHSQLAGVFKEELETSSAIKSVSRTVASPVLEHYLLLLNYDDRGTRKEYVLAGFSGDENFLSTLGIKPISGTGFSGNPAADNNKVVINESLAKLFPNRNLIGAELPGMENRIVAGIVKDFHYSNLKSVVEPAFVGLDQKGGHLMVKASSNQLSRANEVIAQTWEKLIPDYPLSTETIGDRFEWMHRENKNYIMLIGACCVISIFLSMIGLFAIAYQSSKNRTKEIGIRKVNGARIMEIVQLLNVDFVKWVVIAFVLATPVAWYLMNRWLENFAYKTILDWWVFALAGSIALIITLLTVSFQSWKAATSNPVESLRYE